MATDDVHDLFDRDGGDESEGSTDQEGSGAADESAEPAESTPFEEETPADPAREETAESTSMAFDGTVDEGADEPEPDEGDEDAPGFFEADRTKEADAAGADSSGRSDDPVGSEAETGGSSSGERQSPDGDRPMEPTESDRGQPTEGATTPGEAHEPGAQFEPAPSTASPEASDEDDATHSGPAESRTTSPEEPVEDTDPPEAVGSTTPDDLAEDDGDEFEPADPTTTSGGKSIEQGAGESATESESKPVTETESGSVTTTSGEPGEDDDGGFEPGGSGTAYEGVGGTEDGTSEPAGVTASANETVEDDHGVPGSDGTSTATGGPTDTEGPIDTDGPTAIDGSAIVEESTAAEHGERESPTPGGSESASPGTTGDQGVATAPSGSNRLPTGIEKLDRAMGGGIPPGRLVVLVAEPGVQSELIVDSILAQRDTLFVTTDRPDWEVMKDIEPGIGTGEVEIRDHTPDSLLSGLDSLLDDLGTSSNFVLDSVNELELVPRKRYRIFLSDVKRRLFDTGSIGLFTGVTVDHESARDLTLRRADVVLRLETRTTGREIENRLSVPKFRGGAALTETVKLELTDEVRVDDG